MEYEYTQFVMENRKRTPRNEGERGKKGKAHGGS